MLTDDLKTYFAAQADPEKFAQEVFKRKQAYDQFLSDSGLLRLYSKMHWAYFGRENGKPFSTSEIGKDGAEGELHVLKVNHLRSIITGWDSTLGSQRTALEPVPEDGDYESTLQKKRAKAMLNHYTSSGSTARLDTVEATVREYACVFGAGFGLQLWNHKLGALSVPELPAQGDQLGMPGVPTGDMQAWAMWGLNVAFDPWRKDSNIPWYTCKLWYPKHAAVKRWPQFEEELLSSKTESVVSGMDFGLFTAGLTPSGAGQRRSDDEVPLYFFCHAPNEALPNGKQAFLLDGETVLEWDELLYRGRDGARRMPITRLAPADVPESPIGWTPAFGLLASQEAIDSLSSIELTNGRTFGLGSFVSEKGSDIEEEALSMGLMLVQYNKGFAPPTVLKMPTTPETVPMSRRTWIAEMGMMVGVSGASRGDPSAMVDKSGSALAFIDAKSLQYSSKFAGYCVVWREDFYMTTILIAQTFMTLDRQFEVMGQEVSVLMPPFSGAHLNRITKIKVQLVNPLSQTISGRIQLAETVAERFAGQGGINLPQWMRMLEEGNIDFMTRDAAQEDRNMDRENELMSLGIGAIPRVPQMDPLTQMPIIGPDGRPVMVEAPVPGERYVRALIIDDHKAHVLRHRCVLANPAVREASTPEAKAVLFAVMGHIDEHERLAGALTVQRPGLLQLLGQPPLLAALPPMPAGVQVGGAAERGGKNVEGSPEANVEQPMPAGGNEQPRLPSMPTNPSTGRKPPGPAARSPSNAVPPVRPS